jgi:hypothetical protein
VTFGNPFGLALYDREQEGVRRPRRKSKKALIWSVHNEKGKIAGRHENPVEFCIALKSIVTDAKSAAHLMDIWRWNQDTVAHLRQNVPELKTDRDRHYSELLSGLYTQRLTEFAAQAKPPSERQDVEAASKSSGSSSDGETDVGDNLLGQKQNSEIVAKAAELKSSRIRDPDHLKTVAKLACLVCGREPSHAHHIKYAEPRALGRKVGDQWVVPLCATHHRQLHEFGNEETWWQNNRIDPLSEAARIWNGNVATTNQETGIEV